MSSGNLEQSIFAVSDLGNQGDDANILLSDLRRQLDEAGDNSRLILLGNLGNKMGFPDSSNLTLKAKYDTSLERALGLVRDYGSKTILVPGLNEWSNGRQRGLDRLRSLQEYLSDQFENEDLMLPAGGCPGPVEVPISDNTVLLLIDTQWWFQVHNDIEESGCEIKGKGDFIAELSNAVKRNYDKQLVVAGFHPLYSNGPASGYYPVSKHLLPPVIGTLHAAYKRRIGDDQDISNFGYKIFRTIIRRTLRMHPNAIYLSAKEKSLQYFSKDDIHMIISGSLANPKLFLEKKDLFSLRVDQAIRELISILMVMYGFSFGQPIMVR